MPTMTGARIFTKKTSIAIMTMAAIIATMIVDAIII